MSYGKQTLHFSMYNPDCRIALSALTRPEPTYSAYYSNSFDSASSINDGYRSARDSEIQTLNARKSARDQR